jgi:hypothetical protein
MKRNSLFLLVFVLSSIYFIATSSSNGRATAANSGNTGAPSESQVCGNCHNGGSFGTVNLTIQVFIQGTTTPVTAYVPGNTYDIRVTVQNSSGNPAGYGFQLTCLTTPGNSPLAGYTNLASNVKQKTVLVGAVAGRTYVEHNGVLPNNQFNFRWTAPAAGTGSVRMYSAGNAVNGNGSTGSDNGGATSLILTEAQNLTVSVSETNPSCFGQNSGSINLTINTGNPPYTFLWNDGSNVEDRTNVAAGEYSVLITDNAGNSENISITIEEPNPIEATFTIQDAPFFGGTGSFELESLTGGTPPYTAGVEPFSDLSQLPAGNYQFVVLDAANCTSSFNFTVNSPADLEVEASIQNVSCTGLNDGQISASISGGAPPYTVEWLDGSFELERSDLSPGIYSIEVTDNVGYSKNFNFNVEEPLPLQVESEASPIACFGGQSSINIIATGGTAPYTGAGIVNAPAGVYESIVTDANGCSQNFSLTITQPDEIIVQYEAQPISCTGETGTVVFSVSGGTEPLIQTFATENISSPGVYQYTFIDFNNCETTISVDVPAIDGFEIISDTENNSCFDVCDGEIVLSAPDATGMVSYTWQDGFVGAERFDLCSGDFTVSATDENNCTISSSFTITEPTALVIGDFEIVQTNAQGVEIELQISGGTEPYNYAWTTGDSGPSSLIPYEETHNVVVTDANGCEVTSETSFFFVDIVESSIEVPRVYPNPAADFIMVDGLESNAELSLLDMTGRIVLQERISNDKTQLRIDEIESGNYLLKILSSNREFVYRVNVR